MPKGHKLAKASGISLEDVAAHPIITYSPEFSGRSQIDAAFRAQAIEPDIRMTAMDADVIKHYVERGVGVGVLLEMALGAPGTSTWLLCPARPSCSRNRPRKSRSSGALLHAYAYRFVEMLAAAPVGEGAARRRNEPPVAARYAAVEGESSGFPCLPMANGSRSGRELERLLLQDSRPVGVALGDEAGNVGFPLLLDVEVVVQVELAVDDLPRLGVALGGVALGGGPGAVAAILRAYLSGSALKAARLSALAKRQVAPLYLCSNAFEPSTGFPVLK